MCGRFVAASDPQGVLRFFVVDERKADDLPPSWNVAPTDTVGAIVEHEQRRLLVAFRWGLVPSWASDPKVGARMINARAETLTDKPAYREAVARRRCIIPADGFYEWERRPDGSRQAYFVSRADGAPMAFAGLWAVWRGDGGDVLRTCTIVTTDASPALAGIHDRQPVILERDDWAAWLDRGERDPGAVRHLLRPSEPDVLTLRPVGPEVGNVRNNHPGLIEAVA
ncbi:MAG TPA: SOS response-associated peptidase [Egibacteraceae bacterium]